MVSNNDVRAVLIAAATMFAANLGWGIIFYSRASEFLILGYGLRCAPAIAALVAGYLSSYRRVYLTVALALMGAVIGAVVNFGWQWAGYYSDMPGLRGAWLAIQYLFVWHVLLCAPGVFVGRELALRRRNQGATRQSGAR